MLTLPTFTDGDSDDTNEGKSAGPSQLVDSTTRGAIRVSQVSTKQNRLNGFSDLACRLDQAILRGRNHAHRAAQYQGPRSLLLDRRAEKPIDRPVEATTN